jgi:hypothetical protein
MFDKTGVRSRRGLVGKVFFAHYGPPPATTSAGPWSASPCGAGRSPLPPADGPSPGPTLGLLDAARS